MNIGIDAGALGITDERLKMGVYWVNVNLLRELGKIDQKNTYTLYSFAPIASDLMKDFGPRMTNRVLAPATGWMSFRLPLELMFRPVDVFLGLSQAIPSSSAKNIGFLYDLGFLHNPDAYPGSYKKLVSITDHLVKRSSHIVTISHAVKDDIVRHYDLDPAGITVAYPGVDETFTPKGQVHHGPRPYFLFVGALKPGKNIPGLLRGFATFLKNASKSCDLYLGGGDYWKDPAIDELIVSLGLSSSVKKLSFVPDDKLVAYYRGAVALVSPSLYEGFGLPAAEGMACGTPVIGSTAGALPEVIKGGGIVVDPHDSAALAEAMGIMVDTKKRSVYARAAIRQAKSYSWKTFAKTIHALL
jgi:glycosyltransferase involved in cell wall biosynthesis